MRTRNRIFLALLTVLAIVAAYAPLALAQGTNEWSQYQRDETNTGFIDQAVPSEGKVSRQSAEINARDGSQPVVSGRRAYVHAGVNDTSGSVYCFDLTTGQKVWEKAVDPPTLDSWSSPAVSGGVVYAGSGGKVFALSALDGRKVWTRSLGSGAAVVNSSPTVADGKLFIGDWNSNDQGRYLCLDALTGNVLWEFALEEGCHAQSTPAVDGSRVFVGQMSAVFGTAKGKVWCLDRDSGKPVASWGTNGYFRPAGDLDVCGSVAVCGDEMYFTDFTFGAAAEPNSHLYCLDGPTGVERWRKSVYPSSGTPAVTEGLLVTSGNQWGSWPEPSTNWTTAFRLTSGKSASADKLWEKKDTGGFNMSASLAGDRVLVGNFDANTWTNSGVFCLDAGSGETVWTSTQAGSTPVPTGYGVLSIGGGKLVTFGSKSEGSSEFYFAEGCTLPGYQQWICMQNPGETGLKANIRYMLSDGTKKDQAVLLEPTSRTTVDVNLFLGPGVEAAAHVTGDGPFVAERSMYVNTPGCSAGEQVMGATSPRRSFLFAEGTTHDGFRTWLALQNPSGEDADAIVTYYYSGREPSAEVVSIPAESRRTVDVNKSAGAGQDVSIAVTANAGIVAERVLYFSGAGPILGASPDGVHNSAGADKAQKNWYFAEGTTRDNFRQWLCIMNPGSQAAEIEVKYLTFDRGVISRSKTVPPQQRTTINVNDDLAAQTDLSMQVTSDRPVVAERPVYFQYLPGSSPGEMWGGGHNTTGTPYSSYQWLLAEGCTRHGFETHLCIANPNPQPVEVTVDYVIDRQGTRDSKTEKLALESNSRRTVNVKDVVGADCDVSFRVTSLVPVVVERPMYFSYGSYRGGGCSPGLVEAP